MKAKLKNNNKKETRRPAAAPPAAVNKRKVFPKGTLAKWHRTLE